MVNKNFNKISLIYFISLLGVATIFALSYLGILHNEILTACLIQLVVILAVPMFLYTVLVSKSPKQTLKDVGFKKISGKIILISILLGILVYIVNSFVADFFYTLITIFGYEQLGKQTITASYKLFLQEIILSCLLPCICEEFLHRGILCNANKKFLSPKTCIIISSLLFGLTHLNIRQFFYAFILGLLMGYISIITESLYPTIIIHFLNNFINTYLVYGSALNFPVASKINYALNLLYTNFIFYILITVIVVVASILLIYFLLLLLKNEKLQATVKEVVEELNLKNMPPEEAQKTLDEIDSIILAKKEQEKSTKNKIGGLDKIFLTASLILGFMITISSFIWGVL